MTPLLGERDGFTGELWDSAVPIYEAILRHPFISGLTDGSLEETAFRFYVAEDSYYLQAFARALSIAASKAPSDEWIIALNKDAIASLQAEHSLHQDFFDEFGISKESIRDRRPAPTNLAYTNYLIATAYGRPFGEILGSLLPCYWIYAEVGKALAAKGSPNPLYRRWIETYGAESYESGVLAILDVMDVVAETVSAAERRRIFDHYVMTSRYEWMFFDMGYREQVWPV